MLTILPTTMPGFVIWVAGGAEEGKLVLSNGAYSFGAGGSAIPFPLNEVSRGAHET